MELRQALAFAGTLGLQRIDAQLLLLHALGRSINDRAWLLAHDTDLLPDDLREAFTRDCQRRADGEPVAYIVGHKDFHGLTLAVDARVLVPRPDTETLVDWALELLDEITKARVVDLGTGSGAIALAIRHARPNVDVTAVDASADALAVSRSNASRLGLSIDFMQGNWLADVHGTFDLIVSNPPYIAAGDPHLPALHHEPTQALVAGADGLDDIRSIVDQAMPRLKPGGWLLLEHGFDQAAAVRALLSERGFAQVCSRRDLADIERCSGGQRPIAG
jgi:release factor glutamine methyltransferase